MVVVKRTRLRPVSKKRRKVAVDYTAFALGIKDRDGWRCKYCRERYGALDVHHVVKRSQGGGLLDESNAVTLCRACHDWTDAPYASPMGRLVIDTMGGGQFCFSVVHGASKFTVRAGLSFA